MAVNGKRKGNSFELTIAKTLSKHFNDEFTRVPSSGALTGGKNREKVKNLREDAQEILSGDIITPKDHAFCYEVKAYNDEPKFHQVLNGKSLTLDEWINQVDGDASFCNKIPILIFKINRKGTYVAFDATMKDIHYDGQPFMMYKHKFIVTLDVFLVSIGESYYKRSLVISDGGD